MKMIKIACDNCDTDLTESPIRPAYRLMLHVERIPTESECEMCAPEISRPPLNEDAHFCNIGCLAAWSAKANAK